MKKYSFSTFVWFSAMLFVLGTANLCFSQNPAALIEAAKVSTANKEYTAAIDGLTEAIKADPTNSEAFFRRAYAYYLKGDYQSGLTDIDESIRLNSQYATAYGLRGMIHARQKDYDSAIVDNTKAIDLAPTNATWLYNRAVGYEKRATPDWASAVADLTKAIALNPKDSDSFSNRGLAYVNLKEWPKAEKDYDEAVRLGGSDAQLFSNLAFAQYNQGFQYLAETNAKKALALDPNNSLAQKVAAMAFAKLAALAPHSDADLFAAVLEQNIEAVQLALKGGASPNAVGNYHGIPGSIALIAASALQNYPIAKALIDAGANVNVADPNGNTPLSYATGYSTKTGPERAALISMLIKAGADVNAVGKSGSTPLTQASLYAYDESFDELLKAGARVSTRDGNGSTALHTAASRATPRAIKMLIDAGANVNAADANGMTPFISSISGKADALGKIYLMLRAGGELTPAVAGQPEFTDTVSFINRMKAIPADSPESRLFEAVAVGRTSEVESLIMQIPNIDRTLLNYLLLMAVNIDNGAIARLVLSRGADASFMVDNTSAALIVGRGKRPNSAQWINSVRTATAEDTKALEDERRMATLVNNAASGITYARKYMTEAQQMIDRGVEKRLWCVRVGNARTEILQSRQNLDEAAKINVFLYRSQMQVAKDNLEEILRSINRSNCF